MPYTSKAQQRKFHAMLQRGQIEAKTVQEYDKSTNFSKLPERASNPVKAARKTRGRKEP